jgi:rfaE bifunctional protein kinase chain/domain
MRARSVPASGDWFDRRRRRRRPAPRVAHCRGRARQRPDHRRSAPDDNQGAHRHDPRNQQVARVDYESEDAASGVIEDALIDQVEARVRDADVVVVSDYLKGFVTRRVMATVVAAAQTRNIPVLVDPKIPHLDFDSSATLVTPNHYEAETATHLRIRSNDDAQRAAAVFRERARCEGVLITRGEHGLWLSCGDAEGSLPAAAREVADVTGAGDTVVATLALAMAAGATAAEAAHLANAAAGIVVGKSGTATVTPEELRASLGTRGQD